MFTKVLSTISLALALSIQVNGHTLMTPALGVQGAGARSDVQRLAKTGGCGKADAASTIDTSTPVAAAADGTFTVTATNFNRLRDGSRQLTATMDSTGSGDNFNGAVSVTQNGDNRPKSLGSEQIVAAIPAGTTCTGGAAGNLCLVSFQNGAPQGFGNCVVVSQGAAAAASDAGTAASGASAAGTANAGTESSAAGAANAGTASTGAANTGSASTGAANAGTASTGAANAGTASTGAANTGAVNAGTASTGAASTGAESSAAGVSNDGTVSSASNGANVGTGSSAAGANTGATSGASSGVSTGSASGAGVASSSQVQNQAGTRAARALLAELEARGEDMDLIKRGLIEWVWA